MVDEYQKVAALLSMDIQSHALAAANNPHMAQGLMEKLEEKRLLVTNDAEYRDRRYSAACSMFSVAVNRPVEEGGK